MSNFGKGFVEGFSPGLTSSGNLISNWMLRNAQDKRDIDEYEQKRQIEYNLKRKEKLDEAERIYGAILKQIQGGEMVNTAPERVSRPEIPVIGGLEDVYKGQDISPQKKLPQTNITERKFKPLTPEEQIKNMLNIGYSGEEVIKSFTEKPKKNYTNIDTKSDPYAHWAFDKDLGELVKIKEFPEGDNESYTPHWNERIIPKSLRIENINGKKFMTEDIGYYDINADRWKTNPDKSMFVKNPKRVQITEKDKNNDEVFAKEIKTKLKDMVDNQNWLSAQLKALELNPGLQVVDKNGKPIYNDSKGLLNEKTPITKEELKNNLKALKQQNIGLLESLSSEKFNQWTKDFPNLDKDNYWDNLQIAYLKGWSKNKRHHKLDEYDFEVGSQLYQVLFGKNPKTFFGE